MDLKKTKVIFVIDQSGSMQGQQKDVIGGFNGYIETLKEQPGDYEVTLIKFENTTEVVYRNTPLSRVKKLTDYRPGGATALLDAVGEAIKIVEESKGRTIRTETEAITKTGKTVKKVTTTTIESPEYDPSVIVIITDGGENASRKHTRSVIKERIKEAEKSFNTAFIYLGAGEEAWTGGENLGFANNFTGSTKTFYSKRMSDTLASATASVGVSGSTAGFDLMPSALQYAANRGEDDVLLRSVTQTAASVDVDKKTGKKTIKEVK